MLCVESSASTVEEAFERAAEKLFGLEQDLSQVYRRRTIPVSFVASEEGPALEHWLELLLAAALEHGLVFCEFHLIREGAHWRGCATGDRLPKGRPQMQADPLIRGTARRTGDRWVVRADIAPRASRIALLPSRRASARR